MHTLDLLTFISSLFFAEGLMKKTKIILKILTILCAAVLSTAVNAKLIAFCHNDEGTSVECSYSCHKETSWSIAKWVRLNNPWDDQGPLSDECIRDRGKVYKYEDTILHNCKRVDGYYVSYIQY